MATTPLEESEFQKWPSIAASFAVGAMVLVMLGVQPAFLGAMVSEGRLTEVGLGRVATVELLMIAVFSGLAPSFMARGALPIKVLICMLGLAAANVSTIGANSAEAILFIRGVAGVWEGTALAGCIALQMNTRQPERINALFFGAVGIPQIIGGYLLPTVLIPQLGINGAYIAFAVVTVLISLSVFWMPSRIATFANRKKKQSQTHQTFALSTAIILVFVAIIFQNVGNGGGWTYIERAASEAGVSLQAVGLGLSLGLSANVLVSLCIAGFAYRLPARPTLIVGLLLHACVVLLITRLNSSITFILLSIAFNIFWAALLPFYVKLAIELDPSRRTSLYLFGVGLGGIALGPFFSSLNVAPGNVSGAFVVAAIALLLAAVTYFVSFLAQNDKRL